MPPRGTPDSEIVRVTASRPFDIANAPEERIVPGIAPLGGASEVLRDMSCFCFEEPPVEGRVVEPAVDGRVAGSVAARTWPVEPSPVPNDDELALPSRWLRSGAIEFASEREDALDTFD